MNANSRVRTVLRWLWRCTLIFLLILIVAILTVFRGALYNRYFLFPRQAAAWEAIRADRVEVQLPYPIPWKHYRGSAHNHSGLSHDSQVPFGRILQVLKDTDRDFIAMADHCLAGGIADFGAQWRGLHDGKLFIPGYEMNRGFMPWGLADDVVLDCTKDAAELAAEIEALGGLLFIAHPEEPRDWHLPQIRGMEIYNIHADLKDENLRALAPDILLNFRKYPEQTIRLIFDRNTEVLAHWDNLNVSRKIVGIAANDCHENTGIYGVYTQDGNLMLYESSGKRQTEYNLNFLSRLLLRMFAGELTPDEEAFRIQLDPYDLMTRYVATYALASELTEKAILDAFAEGRVYIGFDLLADSSGFTYMARNENQMAVMGERITLAPNTWLIVVAPHRCRVTILRHGEQVYQAEGLVVDWKPTLPGKYRVEAELNILGEWTPWVYTNPIELTRDIRTLGS